MRKTPKLMTKKSHPTRYGLDCGYIDILERRSGNTIIISATPNSCNNFITVTIRKDSEVIDKCLFETIKDAHSFIKGF